MRISTLLMLSLAACSFDTSTVRSHSGDSAPTAIADGNSGANVDASPDATLSDAGTTPDSAVVDADLSCLGLSPFSTPVRIAAVSSGALDNAPTLSADELILIQHSFRSSGVGGRDLWISTRLSVGQSFSTPVNLPNVNSSAHEYGSALSGDGLELFFGSNRSGGLGSYDIYVARRDSRTDSFASPTRVSNVNSTSSDLFPALSADGLALYFASQRSGGSGGYDTWVARRSSIASSFSTPVNLSETNSSNSEEAIAISADELTIFVQSTRSGGLGGYDVWTATRASTSMPFSNLSNVVTINSFGDDQATWLSADGLRLYQSSSRTGTWDIYVSERSCFGVPL